MMQWQKSTYSTDTGECVEVAALPGAVAIRDSKNPDGPVLRFTAEEWRGFLARIKRN